MERPAGFSLLYPAGLLLSTNNDVISLPAVHQRENLSLLCVIGKRYLQEVCNTTWKVIAKLGQQDTYPILPHRALFPSFLLLPFANARFLYTPPRCSSGSRAAPAGRSRSARRTPPSPSAPGRRERRSPREYSGRCRCAGSATGPPPATVVRCGTRWSPPGLG